MPSAPRSDCRECPAYDRASRWCSTYEQTVVRVLGRCDQYAGPRLNSETCQGPECDRATVARGLCATHLRQEQRGRPLTPIRDHTRPAMERVSLRVSPPCRERVLEKPAAARLVLEHWARQK